MVSLICSNVNMLMVGIPWWASGWASVLPLQWARVPSPVKELGSLKLQKNQKNMLWIAPGEKKRKTVKIDLSFRFRDIRGKLLLIWMH